MGHGDLGPGINCSIDDGRNFRFPPLCYINSMLCRAMKSKKVYNLWAWKWSRSALRKHLHVAG